MIENLTVIIPYWNGIKTIGRLLASIPRGLPIILVDDQSDAPYKPPRRGNMNLTVVYSDQKGYFTGAVNLGLAHCKTDVLILNQDAHFTGDEWAEIIQANRNDYGLIGERIAGSHPAYPAGYIHGTFMFIRRDVIDAVGEMNALDYPLWGSTCEYQLRAARAGFKALMLEDIPGFSHEERSGRFGGAITEMLQRQPFNRKKFIRTPPEISVIIPCFNHGRFLPDAINSLIGGPTDLGIAKPQTFQSFEVIIVDDASTDETEAIARGLADDTKAIFYKRLPANVGTAQAINAGAAMAHGKFITVLGADDMMRHDRLETLYRAAQKDPSKVYYDDIQRFENGKLTEVNYLKEYNFDRLLAANFMHAGIFYLREMWQQVGGYPAHMGRGREDWAMNVRLGVSGFCGQHIQDYAGYLYRRHESNRTLTNTNPSHRAGFLAQIQAMYPDIYKGVRPMSCCGSRAKSQPSARSAGVQSERIVPLSSGAVVIEYIGTSIGTQTFYGHVTGARYAAGKSRPLVSADPRDLTTEIHGRPGLLQLSEGGKKLFRLYKAPAPIAPAVAVAIPAVQVDDAEEVAEIAEAAPVVQEDKPRRTARRAKRNE